MTPAQDFYRGIGEFYYNATDFLDFVLQKWSWGLLNRLIMMPQSPLRFSTIETQQFHSERLRVSASGDVNCSNLDISLALRKLLSLTGPDP